jgi:arylsulfatase A-like enzyme
MTTSNQFTSFRIAPFPSILLYPALSLLLFLSGCAKQGESTKGQTMAGKPNVLIIFTDDQGYGDLSCFGSKSIKSPNIDKLATDGMRFTDFYVQPVCGPSRSALLTARYPVRSLGWSMPADEITFAELMRDNGYKTACIGKWDVSNRQPIIDRMPNAQGFDYYFGPLGANDNGKVTFHENNEPAGGTDDMGSLTKMYTDKGINWLRENQDGPFILYLAHTMMHSIIDASPDFKGKSGGNLYDDTVEELDYHTGRLLDVLDELGLRENTLVIFTSDNGPWSNHVESLGPKHKGQIGWGTSGPLRAAKGSTYEGGLRVPAIMRWPGHIPAGSVSHAIVSSLDILPTLAQLTGFEVPGDRPIDGFDQTDLILGKSKAGSRDHLYYYCREEFQCVRQGKWKLVMPDLKVFRSYVDDRPSGKIELYDLEADIGETTNLATSHPDVVQQLLALAAKAPQIDDPSKLTYINPPTPN